MDGLQHEINKIKNNKEKKKDFFGYCVNVLQKSPEAAIEYYNNFIHNPDTIPQEEMSEIFNIFNLDQKIISKDIPTENVFAKKINNIILQLLDLDGQGYDNHINTIIIKLIEIKNKEGEGNGIR